MAKILIVDDEQDIIDNLSMILEAHGYEVASRLDTEGLTDAVKEISPDLIILDVVFPENPKAGFEAARLLHKDPVVAAIPVMLLSAVNDKSDLAFGFSDADISDDFMPVEAFVEKPIEPEVLLQKVEALLHP
jgi:CheY-like chemotaxis protein